LSLPQIKYQARSRINGKTEAVTGTAWFDHEWSSEYLASDTKSAGIG
jgi:predicted secreted hydrolase